jgi:uncharacterized repeat protein (TIGR01451 family)
MQGKGRMSTRLTSQLVLIAAVLVLVQEAGHSLVAGSRPAPARTAQITRPVTEPPLAVGPGPGHPPIESLAPSGTFCPVDPPTPAVSIRVRVPAVVPPGQEITYRICVSNRTRAPAHHVVVRNPIPDNATFVCATPEPSQGAPELIWRLGTLPACACREIVLVLRPTGPGDVSNCARVQFEHGQCVTTRVGQTPGVPVVPQPLPGPGPAPVPAVPGLSVQKTAPVQVLLHDAVPFRIAVANTGATPLTGVEMTDLLPASFQYLPPEGPGPASKRNGQRTLLEWNLGTLAPGQRRTFTYQASAMQVGTFTNGVIVRAAGGITQEASARVAVVAPRLELKVMGQEQRYVTLPAAYDLTVINNGSGPATDVRIVNPVPAGTVFLQASDGGVLIDEGEKKEVRWNLGILPPGTRRTVRLFLRAEKAGEVIERATVSAARGEPVTAERRTRFKGETGLSARIDKSIDPVPVGQEMTYTITVRNTGTADATNLKVTATVPPQMRVQSVRPQSGQVARNVVSFAPVVLEAKEGKREVKYEVVMVPVQEGDVRFRVDIQADQLTEGPLREEASTFIFREAAPGPGPPG